MTSMAIGGGGASPSPYPPDMPATQAAPTSSTWDLAPRHPQTAAQANPTSVAEQPDSPLTMARNGPSPRDIHGASPYGGEIRGTPSPKGGGLINVFGGKNGTLLGELDPSGKRNPDGSLPVTDSRGNNVGSVDSNGSYKAPADNGGEKSGEAKPAKSGDADSFWLASTAKTVAHTVSSAAHATGDAVSSNLEVIGVSAGLAAAIGGAAVVGVDVLGAAAGVLALF